MTSVFGICCSKRFLPGTNPYGNVNSDEVKTLVDAIMDGEASRSDLEKASNNMSTLWASLTKVAMNIRLHEQCDLENHDFSNLSEDISRFLGAFISSAEIIIDASTASSSNNVHDATVGKVIETLEHIFVPTNQQNRKADLIVQLMREYKDWFSYSYMFNRRVGKHPKSSFEVVNQYYQFHQNGNISNDTTNSPHIAESDNDTYKYDEDDDTLGDSFAHESFPAISTPNIAPLNPFSGESYDLPPMHSGSRDSTQLSIDNRLMNHSNDIPFAPDEASIINSYYSNWSQIVEEDEDSDADSSFYVAKKANKRMTRMKSSGRNQDSGTLLGTKKKGKKLTRRRSNSDPPDNIAFDRSSSRVAKSVTFADEHNLQLNSSEEFESKKHFLLDDDSASDHAQASDASPPKKDIGTSGSRFIFSSLEVTSSNDMVQGFDSADEVLPLRSSSTASKHQATTSISLAGQRKLERSNSESSLDLSDMERNKRLSSQNIETLVKQERTQHVPDPWSTGGDQHRVNNPSRRAPHSKLSDESGDDNDRRLSVMSVASASSDDWGKSNKKDPWVTNGGHPSAPRRYRNPLDATLEEEEFKAKSSETVETFHEKQLGSDGLRKGALDGHPRNTNGIVHAYESVDSRASLEKPGILSPPVKIPSIHNSPHRYARMEIGSDSESSPLPPHSMNSPPGSSPTSLHSSPTSDPDRQRALERLKKNFAKMQKAKRIQNGSGSAHSQQVRGGVSNNAPMHSPSPSNAKRKSSLNLEESRSLIHSREGIFSPHLSPSKARLYARRSSPGHRSSISLSNPNTASTTYRKSDLSGSTIVGLEDSPSRRIQKQMPTKLVLEKKPSEPINKEVFEIMEGRRRKRSTMTAETSIPAEFRSSVSLPAPSSSSVLKVKYAPISVVLPQLQPQSSVDIERKASFNQSGGQVLQRLAESVQSVFDRPFQDFPVNAEFPDLSEVALETGVILEGFLNKRSSTFGLWQKVRKALMIFVFAPLYTLLTTMCLI